MHVLVGAGANELCLEDALIAGAVNVGLLVGLVQASRFCVSAGEGGLKIYRLLFIPLSGH